MTEQDSDNELVFLPLGGAGEIGMNLYLYGFGPPRRRQWLMVDLGITFAGDYEPGIDVILPDIRFIEEERAALAGIVLTHAHEDHVGALHDLWQRLQAPVYATPFTAEMLRAKYAQYGQGDPVPIEQVQTGAKFTVGPFQLELVDMAHSIPEPSGVVIRTAVGTAFHSGDWKLDLEPTMGPPIDVARLKQIGAAGVDALISDSTNVLRDGISPSEQEVANTLEDLIRAAPARVAVTTFASNLARILAVARAAKAAGRHLVVAGRAMWRVIHAGREAGYVPEDVEFLTDEDYGYLPRDKVVLLVTGSQGESRAALARMAFEDKPRLYLSAGDQLIFSSKTIPGNEKAVGRIINALTADGVRVITERDVLVHVSGHPRRGEMAQLYDWIKPRVAIPMHGEMEHLTAHVEFARQQGVKEALRVVNGEMVRLCPGPAKLIDEAPTGRLFRDGKLIIAADDDAMRARRRLGFGGIVSVALVLNTQGDVMGEPQVLLSGLPVEPLDGLELEHEIYDTVLGVIDSIARPRRKDPALLEEAVRRAVRAEVNSFWGKRPTCHVFVSIIDP